MEGEKNDGEEHGKKSLLQTEFLCFHSVGNSMQHPLMDKNPIDPENPAEDLKASPKASFRKLFTVGTIGWILASVVLFGLAWPLTKPETVATALLWSTSHWWVAFPVGFLCLVGYGIISRSHFALAARAFLLPIALLVLIASVCQLIYPDRSFRADLFIFLPVVIIFYFLGCIWMALARDTEVNSSFARAVIPAVVGGMVILGFVAVPVFASNDFRYRDTFEFTISKVVLLENSIVADGVVQIKEGGNFNFVTPRYLSMAMETGEEIDPAIEVGTITWGAAGAPTADSKGAFPLQISWNRKLLQSPKAVVPVFDDSICLEVLDAKNQEQQPVYFLNAVVPQ
jgi:hypothetical protein